MSNSRLEKFIYAICGMEVDDLPTPLSRIETLWNCLITGETPVFEPLSRNEKYLMSMLTGDVDALPEPTSRSEKLLYKIATGETDLTDVPGYLSRYEELLKHLIENGGIGGTDFEYVLYTLNDSFSTLYSTAEAPVKSAILKGQTLVNLQQKGTKWTINGNGSNASYSSKEGFPLSKLKPSTKYLIKFNKDISSFVGSVFFAQGVNTVNNINGDYAIVTTLDVLTTSRIGIHIYPKNNILLTEELLMDVEVMIIEYQEGMENWDIPYFEGMQSVKMPVLKSVGKNLFDGEFDLKITNTHAWSKNFIKVLPNTAYIFSHQGTDSVRKVDRTEYYNEKFELIGYQGIDNSITTPNDCHYIKFRYHLIDQDLSKVKNTQLEQGTVATPYEPHKSNILSTPEEIVLKGIGDIQDTLNCNTGEYVERLGEVEITGNEEFKELHRDGSCIKSSFDTSSKSVGSNGGLMCDKLPINNRLWSNSDVEGIRYHDKTIHIAISKDKLETPDVEGIKNYIKSIGGLRLIYKEPVPTVKTVVLSTLDQDGQPTKLSTFNDTTHVSIEAEDLLPTVDLEVATKIEETLSTLPTLMNDISETQHSLNEKIDAQAENIKEVSTAMTEIRNDIL